MKRLNLVLFVIPVCFGILLTGCSGGLQPSGDAPPEAAVVQPSVTPEHLKTLFPDSVGKGKPAILDVYSKFCLACQQLAPKLDALVAHTPGVVMERVDAQHPDEHAKAVLKAFNVTTAPYVAFITGEGRVTHVFLEDTPEAELNAAATTLRSPSAP